MPNELSQNAFTFTWTGLDVTSNAALRALPMRPQNYVNPQCEMLSVKNAWGMPLGLRSFKLKLLWIWYNCPEIELSYEYELRAPYILNISAARFRCDKCMYNWYRMEHENRHKPALRNINVEIIENSDGQNLILELYCTFHSSLEYMYNSSQSVFPMVIFESSNMHVHIIIWLPKHETHL